MDAMFPYFIFSGILSNTYKASIKPYVRDLHLISDGAEPFPGVRFRQSKGHSPGHMSIELGTGKDRLVVPGDVWALSVSFRTEPSIIHPAKKITVRLFLTYILGFYVDRPFNSSDLEQ